MKRLVWLFSAVLLCLAAVAASAASNDVAGNCCFGSCLIYFIVVVVINVAILAWVVSDANKRGTTAGAWLLIVLIFGILGLIAYLVARPQGKLVACPHCQAQRPITAVVCPHCGEKI